jgi:hypothetical protein
MLVTDAGLMRRFTMLGLTGVIAPLNSKKLSLPELVLVHAASLTLSEQHICEIIDNPQQQFKEVSRKKGH